MLLNIIAVVALVGSVGFLLMTLPTPRGARLSGLGETVEAIAYTVIAHLAATHLGGPWAGGAVVAVVVFAVLLPYVVPKPAASREKHNGPIEVRDRVPTDHARVPAEGLGSDLSDDEQDAWADLENRLRSE